jgi:hypothetical protein
MRRRAGGDAAAMFVWCGNYCLHVREYIFIVLSGGDAM